MTRTRLVLFLWAGALFATCAVILLRDGYVSDMVLHQIANHVIFGRADAEQELGILPYDLPTLLYTLVAPVFGANHEIMPALIAIVSAAGLIWLAASPLPGARPGALWTGLFAMVIALDPIVLWCGTAMGERAFAVLVFAFLCGALVQVARAHDVAAFLKLGLGTVVFLFSDPTATVMCVAMIPWIFLTKPQADMTTKPLAYYMVTFTPIAMTTIALCYLNWTKLGQFRPFITALSGDDGQDFAWNALLHATDMARRMDIVPVFAIMAMVFFATVFLARPFDDRADSRSFMVAVLTVLTAPVIAALANLPYRPLDYLPYMAGPLTLIARVARPGRRMTALALQCASVALGWTALCVPGALRHDGWTQALTGTPVAAHVNETAIAAWIDTSSRPVRIDPLVDYRVIALVGRGDHLVMPSDITDRAPDIRAHAGSVLTTRPDTEQGIMDRLGAGDPMIWMAGPQGYDLAMERGPYRIWTEKRTP